MSNVFSVFPCRLDVLFNKDSFKFYNGYWSGHGSFSKMFDDPKGFIELVRRTKVLKPGDYLLVPKEWHALISENIDLFPRVTIHFLNPLIWKPRLNMFIATPHLSLDHDHEGKLDWSALYSTQMEKMRNNTTLKIMGKKNLDIQDDLSFAQLNSKFNSLKRNVTNNDMLAHMEPKKLNYKYRPIWYGCAQASSIIKAINSSDLVFENLIELEKEGKCTQEDIRYFMREGKLPNEEQEQTETENNTDFSDEPTVEEVIAAGNKM
jgi:hypothetical protein